MNCPFCDPKVLKNQILLEKEFVVVLHNIRPANPGQCLVIPKRHYSNYFESTKEEIISFHHLILETKEMLDRLYSPDGYNIGINCNESSGQTVFHTHIHIIPRYKGDVDNPRGGVRGVIPDKKDY